MSNISIHDLVHHLGTGEVTFSLYNKQYYFFCNDEFYTSHETSTDDCVNCTYALGRRCRLDLEHGYLQNFIPTLRNNHPELFI